MSIPDWEHKLVRDPLYAFVGLTERENDILSTYPLQRLARLKQLGHTYIVYPSAVHTRLEHSLGALSVASRMCDRLEIKDVDKEVVRAATLVHDIGHGPFSHVYEDAMRQVNGDDFTHEDITRTIIEKEESIGTALGPLRNSVLDLLNSKESLSSQIVSGSIDADKLDYLRRDSYHTGVFYGAFDLERIVRSVCKIHEDEEDYLAIDEKGKDALESYRLARYSMHAQVYEHHARMIADDMFSRAVISCLRDSTLPREYLDKNGSGFISKYLGFDDSSIEHYILEHGGPNGKDLISRIRSRQLLKRAYYIPLTKVGVPSAIHREQLANLDKQAILQKEKKVADQLGIDPDYVIIHLQSTKIKLYERFQAAEEGEKPILIKYRKRDPAYFDEESPIYAAINPIRTLFVFCPEPNVEKAKEVAEGVFKAKNLL